MAERTEDMELLTALDSMVGSRVSTKNNRRPGSGPSMDPLAAVLLFLILLLLGGALLVGSLHLLS